MLFRVVVHGENGEHHGFLPQFHAKAALHEVVPSRRNKPDFFAVFFDVWHGFVYEMLRKKETLFVADESGVTFFVPGDKRARSIPRLFMQFAYRTLFKRLARIDASSGKIPERMARRLILLGQENRVPVEKRDDRRRIRTDVALEHAFGSVEHFLVPLVGGCEESIEHFFCLRRRGNGHRSSECSQRPTFLLPSRG